MSYDFSADSPIYLQIIDSVKKKIISNKLSPGDRLESVRDLALEYGVNPNTVVKALSELESIGLIYTESTNGKFVTTDVQTILKIKRETINNKLNEFVDAMNEIGVKKEDIIKLLKGDEK